MKKFLPLFLFAAATLTWAANPYTLKNQQPSTTDVTTQTASVNAWKLIGGSPHCKPNTLVATLGAQFCIQNDGYVYKFNTVTKAWDKQTAMGTSVISLAPQNSTTIYALMAASPCSPSSNYGIFLWTGSAWSEKGGCYTKLSAGTYLPSSGPPALLLEGINSGAQRFESVDGGNTWTLASGSWLSANAGTTGFECFVDSSHNVWTGTYGNTLYELAAISSENGTTSGCVWAGPPTVVMAWTSTGWTYSMPLENFGTWQVVAGISSQLITGTDRFHVFAEDGALNAYHWNVNAPTLAAEYGGAWTPDLGCPSPGVHCLSTTQHTVKSRLYFKSGHGLDGKWRTSTNTYNTDIETNVLDTNPQCDPVFGIIDDYECTANFEATDMCDQSGQQIGGSDINYIVDDSIDDIDFSYNDGSAGPMTVHKNVYSGYVIGQVDNVFHEDCWPSDPVPICPAARDGNTVVINNQVDYLGNPPIAQEAALSEWEVQQAEHVGGVSAPYVYLSWYWALLNDDGTVDLPSAICFGGWIPKDGFLYGNYDARPHCK